MSCFSGQAHIAKSALKDAVSKEQSTSSILSLVNREILNNSLRGNFVTSFLCSIDVISKKLKYCCAGHLPALLYRAEEKIVTRLNTQGKLLGCFPDAGLEEKETALRSGDRLFLYTDGITECTNWNKNMYGITSLIEFIEDNAGLSAEDFSEKLIDELQDFSHSSQLQDDVAMVIIDIK
ncbi:MAG TPA: PP2C family protein-serine/threonine phosphatase [Spirochaetota bacterium]|nr:PP2C family protein-serine/threonine phosphatase [Spirochaetota bacterium]